MDVSQSAKEVHENILRFVQRAAYGLDFKQDKARVGMVTYDDSAEVNFYLNTYNVSYCMLYDYDIAVVNFATTFVEVK